MTEPLPLPCLATSQPPSSHPWQCDLTRGHDGHHVAQVTLRLDWDDKPEHPARPAQDAATWQNIPIRTVDGPITSDRAFVLPKRGPNESFDEWARRCVMITGLVPDKPAPCPECGPGYRYGDEGCRHTPPADAAQGAATAPDDPAAGGGNPDDAATLSDRLTIGAAIVHSGFYDDDDADLLQWHPCEDCPRPDGPHRGKCGCSGVPYVSDAFWKALAPVIDALRDDLDAVTAERDHLAADVARLREDMIRLAHATDQDRANVRAEATEQANMAREYIGSLVAERNQLRDRLAAVVAALPERIATAIEAWAETLGNGPTLLTAHAAARIARDHTKETP